MGHNFQVPVKDNIHLSTSRGDSYNKYDNYYITTRGMGKSTVAWDKVYKQWKNFGRVSIVIRVLQADITEAFLDDIETTLNLFRAESDYVKEFYKKTTIKDGVVDVFLQEPGDDEKYHFVRVIAANIKVTRFKSLAVPHPGIFMVDEFIPNLRIGEKWLPKYSWRINECYSTYARFAFLDGNRILKRYWFGNPYSRYIPPLFDQYKIDTLDLAPGAFLVGDDYIVDCQTPSPELQELLKKQNPTLLNNINKEWQDFMEGSFVNDNNYIIDSKQPIGFQLRWVFRFSGHYIGVFRGGGHDFIDDYDQTWWISIMDDWKGSRNVLAFDFDNLISGSSLVLPEDKVPLSILKRAIAHRQVSYADVNAASLMEIIYTNI